METGLVDLPTLKMMDHPVDDLILHIIASMERLRWLPADLGQKYILVNIADFSLQAIENYTPQLSMKVIVGKPYKQTPVFYSQMKYIVFNPYWDVPKSIMTEEILPILKKNPAYLSKNHMKLFNSRGYKINPWKINWRHITPEKFNFTIKQTPGHWNSLGAIKFLFPNPYDVYLHGTPEKKLFSRDVRAYSHGCMRVEDPLSLAVYLLKDQKGWDLKHIQKQVHRKREQWIVLKQNVMVNVTYLTAWIDSEDQLCFANDIYGRDIIFNKYIKPRPFAPYL